LVNGGFKLVFFLIILLSPSFFLLFSLPLDIIEPFSQLFKSHLFQKTDAYILNLLFGSGSDFLLKLTDLLNELLFFLHFNSLLLLFLLLDSFALLNLLVAHFLILLNDFFTFDNNILFTLLDLLHQIFLVLKHLVLHLLSLFSKLMSNQSHIFYQCFLFLNFFLVSFCGSLSGKFHFNFPPLLLLHSFILIFLFHLLFPVLKLALVSHVNFEIFHSLFFFLDFFI
jgi:hypothetical protein